MSVDQRIRQAFADLAVPTVPEVNVAMDRVLVAERRGRVRRRVAVASGVAAAVAAGAVLWGVLPENGGDGPEPAPAPRPSTVEKGPLLGRWATEPLTRKDVRAHLTSAGFSQYANRVAAELPTGSFQLRLKFDTGGILYLYGTRADGEEFHLDQELARTDGDQLVIDPVGVDFEGGTTYEMTRSDTRLALRFLTTDEPDSSQVPAAAWQMGFYTVAPFDRQ